MIDSPSIGGFTADQRTRLVFRAARLRRAGAADQRQPAAHAHRPGLARAARRATSSPARSASTCSASSSMAFVVSATMTAVAGALFAYYPQLRLDRCVLALSDGAIRRDDHHRRHGLDSRRAARRRLRHPVSLYAIEAIAAFLPARFGNAVFALDYAAFGVVMILFLLLEPAGLMGILRRVRNIRSRAPRPGSAS